MNDEHLPSGATLYNKLSGFGLDELIQRRHKVFAARHRWRFLAVLFFANMQSPGNFWYYRKDEETLNSSFGIIRLLIDSGYKNNITLKVYDQAYYGFDDSSMDPPVIYGGYTIAYDSSAAANAIKETKAFLAHHLD